MLPILSLHSVMFIYIVILTCCLPVIEIKLLHFSLFSFFRVYLPLYQNAEKSFTVWHNSWRTWKRPPSWAGMDLINPMNTWRCQLAFGRLNFVKNRVSSFFEINNFLIFKVFGKATSGWTWFALHAQDSKFCFVFSSNQCCQISWEVQNQGLQLTSGVVPTHGLRF